MNYRTAIKTTTPLATTPLATTTAGTETCLGRPKGARVR